MSGRYRCVGGENITAYGSFSSFFKADIIIFLSNTSDTFKSEEGGVSFVHVTDIRFDPEHLQSVQSADAKNNFLSDSHIIVAAIKFSGDFSVFNVVTSQVCVQQIERDATEARTLLGLG